MCRSPYERNRCVCVCFSQGERSRRRQLSIASSPPCLVSTSSPPPAPALSHAWQSEGDAAFKLRSAKPAGCQICRREVATAGSPRSPSDPQVGRAQLLFILVLACVCLLPNCTAGIWMLCHQMLAGCSCPIFSALKTLMC